MAARRTFFEREEPLVTVVIPAFNAERFVRSAIRSALAQTVERLEVLVVDDGSTDSTPTIVEEEAGRDDRVGLVSMGTNSGVSAARNRGFASARGRWIAVLDSDDLMAPNRLERLIQEGDRHNADVIADNLIRFSSSTDDLIPVLKQAGDSWIDAALYIRRNQFFRNSLHYGLLQPLFRADRLRSAGQTYDERLRIAEDDDYYLRLLLKGLRFRLLASSYYFYRQHSSSVSQRIAAEDVGSMLAASGRLLAEFPDHPLRDLLVLRHRSFDRAADYLRLIAALKRKDVLGAARIAYSRPSSLPLLRTPVRKAFRRLLGPAQQAPDNARLRLSLQEAMRSAGDPDASFASSGEASPQILEPRGAQQA